MPKIIECVPNFSEGRDKGVIDAIAAAIRSTAGCTLLDVDPGRSTNRTVFTFVGGPETVVEGALNAARVARDRIDMRTHTGEHPRMGAMDVCPFVPVANVSMAECVAVSRAFAKRAAEELGIPLFLYEAAAKQDYRRTLPQIREGEYEGLADKLKQPAWKPDCGPDRFVPEWWIRSPHVRRVLGDRRPSGSGDRATPAIETSISRHGWLEPRRVRKVKGKRVTIDIPWSIDALKKASRPLAKRWRTATRKAFRDLLGKGYVVHDYQGVKEDGRRRGRYYLEKGFRVR